MTEKNAAVMVNQPSDKFNRHVKVIPQYYNRMVCNNLDLVKDLARNYDDCGVPAHKLVQRGNIELMECARKFDPEKGFSFRLYASWCIKKGMSSLVAEAIGA